MSCQRIDLDALYRDVNQLWAEAAHRYHAGEPWHLDAEAAELATAEQDSRLLQTELDAGVAEYLASLEAAGRTEVTTREVFSGALNLDPTSDKYAEQAVRMGAQVAAAIEAAGWSRVARKGKGANKRTIYRMVPKSRQEKNLPLHARAHIGRQEKDSGTLGDHCPKCAGDGCRWCNGTGRKAL